MSSTRQFATLDRGLDRRLPPMRLWEKAKAHGIWNPSSIDFTQDRADWLGLSALEREIILHLSSLFQAGEESVTLDLLPLIQVVATEGRLEEELFLTSFLWEEAKHVDAFDRFFLEVTGPEDEASARGDGSTGGLGQRGDLTRFESPSYRSIFHQALPQALERLRSDSSPVAQAGASVTYNMIVEGVLAETGYHAYYQILERHGILPGMQTVVGHLKRDESRHLAYGVYLLSRLVAEHGDPVWEAIEERMSALLPAAIGVVHEIFERYPEPPFGLRPDDFVEFAMSQFQRRLARIEKARGKSLEDVQGFEVDEEPAPTLHLAADSDTHSGAGRA